MSTTNNVVSMEHSVIVHIENAIVDVLSNRAGKWVAPHVLLNAAEPIVPPNMNVFEVIDEMVNTGVLEKSFTTIPVKFGSSVQAPLYRLTPTYSW